MRCHCLRIFGAIIRKVIGAIRHPTSDIGRPTFEIRHPTSHIWHPRFDIRHPTSEIRHPTSDIRDLTSDIRHPTSEIRHLTSEIWHPRSEIRRLTFERMALMCSAWDEGTYEVRFERKQCRLFCCFFFKYYYHFALFRMLITPVCSFIGKRAAKSYPFQVCTVNLNHLLLHI